MEIESRFVEKIICFEFTYLSPVSPAKHLRTRAAERYRQYQGYVRQRSPLKESR